jgi:hypothetical protein
MTMATLLYMEGRFRIDKWLSLWPGLFKLAAGHHILGAVYDFLVTPRQTFHTNHRACASIAIAETAA